MRRKRRNHSPAFKSKAQLRDDLADADDGSNILVNLWNRITRRDKTDEAEK